MREHDVYPRMRWDRVLSLDLFGHGRCRIEAVDMARVGEGPIQKLRLPR